MLQIRKNYYVWVRMHAANCDYRIHDLRVSVWQDAIAYVDIERSVQLQYNIA